MIGWNDQCRRKGAGSAACFLDFLAARFSIGVCAAGFFISLLLFLALDMIDSQFVKRSAVINDRSVLTETGIARQ